MPVKRRTPKIRKHDLPVWQQEFLLTGQEPVEEEDINVFAVIQWKRHRGRNDPVKVAWSEYGDGLLQEFIEAYPGCRCYAWWEFSAPEPRLRIAGTGSPKHEHLAYMASYRFGIPVLWISAREVEIYSGRAKDKDGNPIHKPRREFTGVPIDQNDPPQFESQAAYLDRHGLLTERERKVLHADAFIPEVITEDPTQ